MKTLTGIGLWAALSMTTIGWIPAAMSKTRAPAAPAAETRSLAPRVERDLSEYVYLHVTRNQSIATQHGTRASTCRGTSRAIQS